MRRITKPNRLVYRVFGKGDQQTVARLGLKGASRHQQTLVTSLAKKIVAAGGSLRDVQRLAGHASLSTIPRFIEGSRDDKRKDVVTQCSFARHMVALRVSEPDAERIRWQKNPRLSTY